MDKIVLPCEIRSEDKPKVLRRAKLIPAECYSKGEENLHLQLDYNTFMRAFQSAGYNTVVELTYGEGKSKQVMIQDVDAHPVTDLYTHVDFIAIKQDQEIFAEVPLKFVNFSPAVKDEGGVLVHLKDVVEIKCFPQDLIHEIEVDLSSLADLHAKISVSDLKVPSKVVITDDPEAIVIQVTVPRVQEEEETAPALAEGEAPAADAAKTEGEKEKK